VRAPTSNPGKHPHDIDHQARTPSQLRGDQDVAQRRYAARPQTPAQLRGAGKRIRRTGRQRRERIACATSSAHITPSPSITIVRAKTEALTCAGAERGAVIHRSRGQRGTKKADATPTGCLCVWNVTKGCSRRRAGCGRGRRRRRGRVAGIVIDSWRGRRWIDDDHGQRFWPRFM
jgi:hypothetical protein